VNAKENQNDQHRIATTNKIALVTGGSRGLGRNIALQLARKSNDVILTYRQKKKAFTSSRRSCSHSSPTAAAS